MFKKIVSTSVLAAALGLMTAGGADAMTFDKRTYFTFSQPFALPGVTLPAGTYVFHLADPMTSRKVTHVTNEKGTQSYAMLLTMPAYRTDIPKDAEIRFMETAAGMPPAVKSWWVPGESTGYEFIYSKEQRARLNTPLAPEPEAVASVSAVSRSEEVAVAGEPIDSVAFEERESAPEVAAAEPVAPPDAFLRDEDAAVDAEQSAAQQPVTQPATPQTNNDRDRDRTTLPRTATELPLMLLAGLSSVFSGWMLRKS
jgi:hypothetical protein